MNTLDTTILPDSHLEAGALSSGSKTENFTFYGSGAEYFRIWIVNLLLTLVTLGIYSAWAKVRRMKYLHDNTELMGARFGYHGDPFKILIGRIAVVVVVGGFYGLSHFFPSIVPVGSVIWITLLPALLTFALYFRLRNTSYRHLRFSFQGSVSQAYRVMALPLGLSLVGLLLVGVGIHFMEQGTISGSLAVAVGILMFAVYILFPFLVMPLFHVQWQQFSHQHSFFGNLRFGFTATLRQYMKAYRHILGAFFLFTVVVLGIGGVLFYTAFKALATVGNPPFGVMVLGFIALYFLMFAIQPYIKAVFFNLAWNHSSIAGQSFRSSLTRWGMVKLGVANLFLTIVTLGFYRPFAVIRTQRYLLEHLHLDLTQQGAVMVDQLDQVDPAAHAEGALDLLGDVDM
jgi:uncharacterized membrane protein YjgN (DUF898 family)